jgi:hypothetical protein
MLATVYLYLGKKYKHPRTVGVRERERRREKRRGEKVFRKILGMGEWAPSFSLYSSPTPLSISPRGFHVKQVRHGRPMVRGMMAGHRAQAGPQGRHNRPQGRPSMAPRQAQGISRPTGRLINWWWSIRMGKWEALSFQGFQVMTSGHDLICLLSHSLCISL